MAVVTAGAVSIYSLIRSNQIKSLAGKTNDVISDLRSNTLTKSGQYELIIRYNSSSKKYIAELKRDGTIITTTTIGNKGNIFCMSDIGTARFMLKDGYEIHLKFDKADGSFSEISCSQSGVNEMIDNTIHVEYSNLEKVIKLIELTGKHYIE